MRTLKHIISEFTREVVELEENAKNKFGFNDLTLTQWHYLETISTLNNPNFTEVAEMLNISKPTVTVAIEKLIEKKYIYKTKSDEDRRSMHLHLTEKGKILNKIHEYAHKKMADRIEKKLDENDVKLLIEVLNRYLNK